ncbi:hypothetical protein [Sphingorhabdus sp.]|uniref:hypothetical protein n=1 Tax=Sphingorhabdus sp. TaxID=1902408 RepID=UPI003BAF8030|nr:hypothetical protein [Sphingomonadales bacterium]MBK9431758.1 hypothetical protein [Sphingomonadales bacterium]MBL0022953.1 hypothetical protein [Sphingomonadales bacterium]
MTELVITRDFKGVKADALISLYRSLNDPKGLARYSGPEIANLMGWKDGNQYLLKALASLEAEGLVVHRVGSYEITEEGILVSEQTLVGGVPASDRIVSLNHNAPEVRQIVDEANNLETLLSKVNDFGSLTEEEVKTAATEVRLIREAFETDFLRPTSTYQRAKSTLEWIGTKAAEAVIGAAALGLLALIAAFFGFAP